MSTLSSVTAAIAGPSVALAQTQASIPPDPTKSPPPYAPQAAPTAVALTIAPQPATAGASLGSPANGNDPGYNADGSPADGSAPSRGLIDIRV